MKNDKYTIIDNFGKVTGRLNPGLAERQHVSDSALEQLKQSHLLKDAIFEMAKQTDSPERLQFLAKMTTLLEFEQQELWNFPRDATMHRWFEFPHCSCPKLDNMDRLGSGTQVVSSDCPIHGQGPSSSMNI